MAKKRYPLYMTACPSIEDREKMRLLINTIKSRYNLAGEPNKTVYQIIMIALEKLDKEMENGKNNI